MFHPTASNVLASASGDHLVRLWDIENGKDSANLELKGHSDTIQSFCWNTTGTALVTVRPAPAVSTWSEMLILVRPAETKRSGCSILDPARRPSELRTATQASRARESSGSVTETGSSPPAYVHS